MQIYSLIAIQQRLFVTFEPYQLTVKSNVPQGSKIAKEVSLLLSSRSGSRKKVTGGLFASLPVFVTTVSSQATHLAWLGTAPKSVRRLKIALRLCGGSHIGNAFYDYVVVN